MRSSRLHLLLAVLCLMAMAFCNDLNAQTTSVKAIELAVASHKRPIEFQFGGYISSNKVFGMVTGSAGITDHLCLDSLTTMSFPLRVGIALRVPISERISLETGLNYEAYKPESVVRNSRSGAVEKILMKSDTRMTFIGLPLKMDIKIFGAKRFELYSAVGGEVSYNLRRTGKIVDGDGFEFSFNSHRFRYSVTCAAGIDYNISSHISLFAEPGFSLLFNTFAEGGYVYIEEYRPFAFGLSAGIRFRLN